MKHLNPRAILFFFLTFSARWFIVLFLFGIYLMFAFTPLIRDGSLVEMGIGAGIDALVVLFSLLVCAVLWYTRYGYTLTSTAITVTRGIIMELSVSIPYEQIQDIILFRGILDRLLGLSDMHIRSAGTSIAHTQDSGTIAEARLPGLSVRDAEALRSDLLARAKHGLNAPRALPISDSINQ